MIFNESQQKTLRALLDRLIPPDDYPGGWDGGSGSYISLQLDGDLAPLQETYRSGLDSLTAEARDLHDLPFWSLEPDSQDELLRRVEAGIVSTTWSSPPARFLQTVVQHAAEGYYADPGNGGNPDARSWEMIGFIVHENWPENL